MYPLSFVTTDIDTLIGSAGPSSTRAFSSDIIGDIVNYIETRVRIADGPRLALILGPGCIPDRSASDSRDRHELHNLAILLRKKDGRKILTKRKIENAINTTY